MHISAVKWSFLIQMDKLHIQFNSHRESFHGVKLFVPFSSLVQPCIFCSKQFAVTFVQLSIIIIITSFINQRFFVSLRFAFSFSVCLYLSASWNLVCTRNETNIFASLLFDRCVWKFVMNIKKNGRLMICVMHTTQTCMIALIICAMQFMKWHFILVPFHSVCVRPFPICLFALAQTVM